MPATDGTFSEENLPHDHAMANMTQRKGATEMTWLAESRDQRSLWRCYSGLFGSYPSPTPPPQPPSTSTDHTAKQLKPAKRSLGLQTKPARNILLAVLVRAPVTYSLATLQWALPFTEQQCAKKLTPNHLIECVFNYHSIHADVVGASVFVCSTVSCRIPLFHSNKRSVLYRLNKPIRIG